MNGDSESGSPHSLKAMPLPGSMANAQAPNQKWIGSVLVGLIGAFMAILDSSIVNVAVPKIMSVFNANPDSVQWVSTIYLLAMGVVTPLTGWLGEKFGYKRLYIFAMCIFVAGSLLCGISWSLNSLIVFRVFQAIGGGMIMPVTMAMTFQIVPRDKIGMGMSVFGIAILLAPTLGPTLGGYLVEYVDWRWIFTINLPVGAIGVVLAGLVLPEHKGKNPGKLDLGGAVSSAVMLFCLLLAFSKVGAWGWTDERIVLLLVVAVFAGILFVYLEMTHKNPLLDLRVFKYPSFLFGNIILVVTTIGIYTGMFYLPLFLQTVRGLGAMETGFLLMPGALASGLLMPVVGKIFDKTGPKVLTLVGITGLVVLTYNFHNLTLSTASGTIVVWVVLRGAVMAFANMPANTAAMVDIPPNEVGKASAIVNIIRNVAASFGLALLTSLLTQRQDWHSAQLSWSASSASQATQAALGTVSALAGGGAHGNSVALSWLAGQVRVTAFVQAIDDVFIAAAIFTIIAFVPTFFLKKPKGGVNTTGTTYSE